MAQNTRDQARLEAYETATNTKMVLVSLIVVPIYVIESLTTGKRFSDTALFAVAAILVQAIMAADLAYRVYLAPHRLHYLRHHKLHILAILIPPARAAGEVVDLRAVLKRKGVLRFSIFSGITISACALVVYGAERSADDSTINSMGDAMWWAVVTTTTVGYGDVVPVTSEGRRMAVILMMLGVVILAVVTANIAAVFVDSSTDSDEDGEPDNLEVLERLERLEVAIAGIEQILTDQQDSSQR